uniref:Uncharacterized protein n=1 Tax=Oryza nivara TaxID=4536 RepID=A0A0E0G5Q8_ORYNI
MPTSPPPPPSHTPSLPKSRRIHPPLSLSRSSLLSLSLSRTHPTSPHPRVADSPYTISLLSRAAPPSSSREVLVATAAIESCRPAIARDSAAIDSDAPPSRVTPSTPLHRAAVKSRLQIDAAGAPHSNRHGSPLTLPSSLRARPRPRRSQTRRLPLPLARAAAAFHVVANDSEIAG